MGEQASKCPACGAAEQDFSRYNYGPDFHTWECLSCQSTAKEFIQTPECYARQREHVAGLLLAACKVALNHHGAECGCSIVHELRNAITQAEAVGVKSERREP